MPVDAQTIDRIVAGVLHQLSAGGNGAPVGVTAETPRRGDDAERSFECEEPPSAAGAGQTVLTAKVVTAEVLLAGLAGGSRVVVSERAVVTPAAWDAAREHSVEITRQRPRAAPRGYESVGNEQSNQRQEAHGTHGALPVGLAPLLVVVRSTRAVEQLSEDVRGDWRRELLGCVDEAAALAVSAVCRGETETVVLFAEQTHRAACLANRNERIHGVAISDGSDVRAVRSQLRANVWCIDPTGRSWFELRNLLKAISIKEGPR